MRWFSSCFKWSLSAILMAQVNRVLIIPIFWAGWWWESACRYRLVCVYFLYTWFLREPSCFLIVRTSRNGRQYFYSLSVVNFMLSDWLLRWSVKSFKISSLCGQLLYTSSINHSHHFGFTGKESGRVCHFVESIWSSLLIMEM